MKVEKLNTSIKKEKPKAPKTIKDIEETLKEMDKIHNTSFYNWIKDENNVSVIAFKTKDLFQENYEKQPELVYNALRFLCKDWKLSKIAELILKLFYKCNVASEKLAIIIYEVSLLLENPEKVDLISLLLIGEEPKNVAFFLYHYFIYTEKKYREHSVEIIKEEEFLDEMNAFCSGMLECLYTCLKWNNDYFKELILEYITLSTLNIDVKREFLIRMVNVKYAHFLEEIQKRKESTKSKESKINSTFNDIDEVYSHKNIDDKNKINGKIDESDDIFKRSLNFGILVFNMFQVVMRTDVDDLLTISSPTTKKESTLTSPINHELIRDKTLNLNDDEYCDDLLSENSISICSSKRIALKRDDEDNLSNSEKERMRKDESSTTLWMDDNEVDDGSNNIHNNFENNNDNDMSIISKDSMSAVYNFGYDSSSVCRSNTNDINIYDDECTTSTDPLDSHISCNYEEFYRMEEEENEPSVSEEFINKSIGSNSSRRRNSRLSLHTHINDHSVINETPSPNPKNTFDTHSSNSRRSSRYSLNLSIHSMPCCDSYDYEERLITPTSATIYNNYSDNRLYVFPSPPNSPTFISDVVSEIDFDPCPNTSLQPQSERSSINETEDEFCEYGRYHQHQQSHYHRNNVTYFNETSYYPPSSTLTSPTTSNHFYRSFSPDLIPPSPIVQSLSMDNLMINSCGYSCTFNHISSSTPNIHATSQNH